VTGMNQRAAGKTEDVANPSSPLFVDLDGTLIRTDMLVESFLHAVRKDARVILKTLGWLLQGKAVLKARLAELQSIDVSTLPFREELVSWLREERQRGREIYLATASNRRLAEAIAGHLGIFSGVLASDESRNLKGKRKLEAIRALAPNGFAYAGNGPEDIVIWGEAKEAILVACPSGVAARAQGAGNVAKRFDASNAGRLSGLVRALRPHQWLKNLLVFVPLLTAFLFRDGTAWLGAMGAFAAFSLVASGTYIVNDLLDLEADRAHPRKRKRPFAAGQVMPQAGLAMAFSLVGAGFVIGAWLPPSFLAVLAGYLALTLAYSLVLKTYVLLDALALAALYTLRVIGGAAALTVQVSVWLLAFSVFIFFSLALVKRCAELHVMREQDREKSGGRDYRVADLPMLQSVGIASSLASIVVFTLYLGAPENAGRFSSPHLAWVVAPFLLYWVSRVWIKTGRGEMHDDPVVFAIRDRGSRLVVLAIVFCFAGAALL